MATEMQPCIDISDCRTAIEHSKRMDAWAAKLKDMLAATDDPWAIEHLTLLRDEMLLKSQALRQGARESLRQKFAEIFP